MSLPELSAAAAPVPQATGTQSVRLGVIDYLNVAPVYDWLQRRTAGERAAAGIALVSGVPAEMNAALARGAVDLSNVSSFAFGEHADEWLLVPGLSVAAHGRLECVLLFSGEQQWEALAGGSVAVSSESATSVALTRLLCARRYGVQPRFVPRAPDLDAMLAEHDAALLIGDTALREGQLRREIGGRRPYVFDLAAEWQAWMGMPFVFSVWAARADRADAIRASGAVELLRASKHHGLADLDALAASAAARLHLPLAVCAAYLRLLDYDLAARDLDGLRAFLELSLPGFRWEQVRLL
ncbi:MAG: menaquinone biosynthetic enzyme MqnA/MqnD family protein [Ktedonobacterales bacterium]